MISKKVKSLLLSLVTMFIVIIMMFPAVDIEVSAYNYEDDCRVIVSMGDSYSAGEGLGDYYGEELPESQRMYDQDFLSHRSKKSWPAMLKRNLNGSEAIENQIDKNWFFVAMSGAVTKNIIGDGKPLPDPITEDYIEENKYRFKNYLNRYSYTATGINTFKVSSCVPIDFQIDIFDDKNLKNKEVDYVTMTIGGNDVDFVGIVTTLLMPETISPNAINDKLTQTYDIFTQVQLNLENVYETVSKKAGKQAHIIVAGYPRLLEPQGKGALISKGEANAVNAAIDVFNNLISATVTEQGDNFSFVPVDFSGHEVYSDDPWLYNYEWLIKEDDISDFSIKNRSFISAASFHPNPEGAAEYARLVNDKIEEIEKAKKNSQKTNTLETKKEEESKKVLSPESAVNIYMANKDVWGFESPYTPMQGYGYCLLDLDFDGVLELICSSNDGTGKFSHNKYYRINQDTYSVEEIHSPNEETNEGNYSGYDYYFRSAEYPKLLRNKSDNKMFYYCTDITQVMAGEFGTSYGEMYLAKDEIKCEDLFYEYTLAKGIQGNNEEVQEFHFCENGSDTKISEKQYNEKQDKFFKNNKDLNLNWTCVNGNDFDSASNNKQIQLLLDAYRNYSYDGFSFDKVSTYNIPTDAKKTSNETEINIWKEIPNEFYFSSGAGAWRTVIEIEDDGSFVGEFSDSDMGMTGEGYPKGTQYICSFSGKFTKPEKVTDFIYKMNLEKLDVKETPGKEYCKDEIKYVCWEPYGMDNAEDFCIYLPGTPMSDVDEMFLSWAHLYNYNGQELPDGFYGIYNIRGKEGFIAKDK